MKICTHCKKEKPLKDFGERNITRSNGEKVKKKLSICKQCNSERAKKRYFYNVQNSINTVYRLLNKYGDVLYVGKTSNLPTRVSLHMSKNGHLPKSCIEQVDKIEFLAMESRVLMDIKELYYINLYKPVYNSNHIEEESFTINDFLHDKWKDISLFSRVSKEFENDEQVNQVKEWRTIFVRKRNKNYIVYVEIVENGVKKHINKGSFKTKYEAEKLAEKLRSQKEYVRKVIK